MISQSLTLLNVFYETVRNRRLLLALTENGLGLDSVSPVYQGQKFIVP